ncbi:MAG: transglycosylase SLT domain-containing protein [Gemmatimonadetes bacterium]|nr:transglycosylase SLT domain-containing protein [Gemmatimonadota bacterium]
MAVSASFGPAFDWRIFRAQGMAESNFGPQGEEPGGARGVMRLMPATFREIASKNPELKRIDHPEMNIAAGIAYDRQLWTRWEGDSVLTDVRTFTFASYNAGAARCSMRRRRRAPRGSTRGAGRASSRWPPKVERWRHVEHAGLREAHRRLPRPARRAWARDRRLGLGARGQE